MPQAAATVSEMASIRRPAIDRSWNMETVALGQSATEVPRKCLTTACER
jgi:hypothetical protein